MKRRSALKIARFIIFDILIVFSSFIIAFYLRGIITINLGIFSMYSGYIVIYISIILVIKLSLFALFGMYRRVWKYASIKDMVAIVEAVALSTIVMAVIFYVLSQPIPWFDGSGFTLPYFPRSILIIDFLLTLLLLVISRFSERIFNEIRFGRPGLRKKRVLIVGAGDAGEMIVREMIRQKDSEYTPVGFLDDDTSKINHRIHGVKVLAPISRLEELTSRLSIDEIIIAIPSASSKLRRKIAFRAKETGVTCKTLPSLYEVIDGRTHLYQVREINVEDILGRETVKIKADELKSKFKDKNILVTGAGGSIGSEICRQLLRFDPARIVMVDHSENNLFNIENEISSKYNYNSSVPIVANIKDSQVMKSVFKRYKVQTVFHAAAYKHVPLMQLNPEAAIQNNFIGTGSLAKVAIEANVKRFVLLSSDKAVKPRNIMGISKLLAEHYLKAVNGKNGTKFMIVRFGNVLESNGSVINIFKKQIKAGGPVSVTHPDMLRYIMTISEAAQLAIQASIMGNGGDIFVLNMGKLINILELARNMIKLYGMIPDKDIEIIYTGPRNGEKMYEELASDEEELIPSGFNYIYKIKEKNTSIKRKPDELMKILSGIEKEIRVNDYSKLFRDIRKLVPDFDEKEMWFSS